MEGTTLIRVRECGEAIEQGGCFEQAAAALCAKANGIGAVGQGLFVAPDLEIEAQRARCVVAELEHLVKLVAGVDMQERKRDGSREKGFLRQAKHDRGVFADRVQHDRLLKFRSNLAEDVDALGFETLEMAQSGRGECRLFGLLDR